MSRPENAQRPGRARLRIPRRLRIRGRTWRVVFTRRPPRAAASRGKRCWGVCRHNRAVISIWAGLLRRQREETFAHEILHALAGPAPSLRDAAAEERIVARMAPALREVLLSGRRWRTRGLARIDAGAAAARGSGAAGAGATRPCPALATSLLRPPRRSPF